MKRVSIDDPAWRATFPQPVAPLDEEWVAGLLLRCDEANHWESGTTVAHLLRANGYPLREKSNLIVASSLKLDSLAQWLEVPKNALLLTTYHAELSRIIDVPRLHSRHLNPAFTLHICPACIAEERRIQRVLVLPHIRSCPLHHLALLKTCQCGAPLQLFSEQVQPFTCHKCRADWAGLPQKQPTAEQVAFEQKHLPYYSFFFSQKTPKAFEHAVGLIIERMIVKKEKIISPVSPSERALALTPKTVSLGALIGVLAKFNLSPHDILTYDDLPFLEPYQAMRTYKYSALILFNGTL